MVKCQNCIHALKIHDTLQCRRRSPIHTDLSGYAMWPWVREDDTCSEGERQPMSITEERDYLKTLPRPAPTVSPSGCDKKS